MGASDPAKRCVQRPRLARLTGHPRRRDPRRPLACRVERKVNHRFRIDVTRARSLALLGWARPQLWGKSVGLLSLHSAFVRSCVLRVCLVSTATALSAYGRVSASRPRELSLKVLQLLRSYGREDSGTMGQSMRRPIRHTHEGHGKCAVTGNERVRGRGLTRRVAIFDDPAPNGHHPS
jgi:hypothetical protein